MRIARAKTARQEVAAALTWLQSHLFSSDPALDVHTGDWWIAREDGAPVAFAALLPVPSWSKTGYMARCGVLPAFRGQGLQRKLLAHREAHARRLGMLRVITTTYDNPASANNLIRHGYFTYRPQQKWGAANTIYWLKTL